MKHKVIDNFLDEEYFDSLVTIFTGRFNLAILNGSADNTDKEKGNYGTPWYFQTNIIAENVTEDNLFYMTHMVYDDNSPKSHLYKIIIPLLKKISAEPRCLIRIKANLYPHTHNLHEHPLHVDYHFSNSGALFSLNTCDGYTKLKDGTKIDSVANRILLFDAGEEHCSTTTTNAPARFNININYI